VIAVVAHDAGGAEILSSYVRRSGLPCRYALAGPAVRVFERKLGPIDVSGIEDAVRSSSSVLCGTSWQSDLELGAIAHARGLGKPSVAFLDHWVNYHERFQRAGGECLPDEIWVGDAIAESLARRVFQSLPVRLVENPYFEDIRQELAACPRRPGRDPQAVSVLYVTEPVRAHALRQFGNERHWGYGEEDALRYFLAHVAVLGRPVERIVIRPHPAESPGKYHWAAREFDLPIEGGGARPLVEDIVEADVVAGCESMAMVVGLLAGKRVVSSIPPGGHACRLPHPGIEHCQELVVTMKLDNPA
jgi:hypothetical protein